MILDLLREQARAHRAYLAWTGAFIAVTVTLVGFVTLTAAQQLAAEQRAYDAFGLDGEWSRRLWIGMTYEDTDLSVTWAELDAALDSADAEGAETAALHEPGLFALRPTDPGAYPDEVSTASWGERGVVGVRGAVDWDALLLEGSAPGAGEAAVDAEWARFAGVDVGERLDVVQMWNDTAIGEFTLGQVTVAGLTRSSANGRYDLSLPVGILPWDDAVAYGAEVNARGGYATEDGLVEAGAAHETPALAVIPGWPGSPWFGSSDDFVRSSVLLLTAGVLVCGVIGMAFSTGRAQAQSRSRWVATARALGARRSTLVWAAAAEAAAVGIGAGTAGLGAAWALTALDWRAFVAANPDTLLGAAAPPAVPIVAGLVVLALILAGIVAAIPAYWAVRTTPSAALKPVAPLTATEPRHRLRLGWLVAAWIPVLAYASYQGRLYHELPLISFRMPWLVFPVAGVMMLVVAATWARRLVAPVARRLAESSRPWALSAGHALVSRPRQAAGPATVFAVVSAGFGWFVAHQALQSWAQHGSGIPAWLPEPLRSDTMLVPTAWDGFPLFALATIAFALLTAVAGGAAIATAASYRGEQHARAAMGLPHGAARLATAAEFALPLVVGIAAGLATGFVGAVASFSGSTADTSFGLADAAGPLTSFGPLWALVHATHALLPALMMAGIALGCVAAGAAVVAATIRTRVQEPVR
ncbi:FtsX-like permease family protein [Demequina mangrovi]|uniref:FtsX-like permease family protein n=1 Tax=Demequina mangrovi TaxID=1043493 RepID=A0A1H7A8Z8_9MICO|nr:FtsX-like permease family protein [Demequina mangrovi]SEJ62143.1 FtsX-like permease family protein [Demequina mangrovi]